MAITFTQEKKKQKYLILILALVIFAIILIVWRGFFREEAPPPGALPAFIPPKVEIDWMVLKDPRLQELQVLEEIPSFEEKIGRENPFVPY